MRMTFPWRATGTEMDASLRRWSINRPRPALPERSNWQQGAGGSSLAKRQASGPVVKPAIWSSELLKLGLGRGDVALQATDFLGIVHLLAGAGQLLLQLR